LLIFWDEGGMWVSGGIVISSIKKENFDFNLKEN
jgi:hypothetical protein